MAMYRKVQDILAMICASPKLNISTSVAHQTMGLQQLFLECFALVLTYEKPKSESRVAAVVWPYSKWRSISK